MNARHAFWAKGLLLVSGTGLLINGAATLFAGTDVNQTSRTRVKQLSHKSGQTAGQTESLSPIQKALRERYRRAGLEMPPMNLSALPKTAADAKRAVRNRRLQRPGVASRSASPSRRTGGPIVHPKSTASRSGLLSRILPASSKIHWPARPNIRWPSGLKNWNKKLRGIPRIARRNSARPGSSARKSIVRKRQPRQIPGMLRRIVTKRRAVPAITPPVPVAARQSKNNEPKAVPTVAAKEITKAKNATAVATDDGLNNPFSEMSEAEADKKTQSPFTGLTLNEADKQAPVVAQKPQSDGNAAPPLPDSANANVAQASSAEAPHSAKLNKIAERAEQTGLKGFCPVVLRDKRDLVDAKTEFTATYKSRTYHFSSADAQAAFDEHPEKYAPAGAGLDVVRLANHGDRVDGTLDYAVWFQDRLYLFSTADSLRTFTIAPTNYAVEKLD